MGFLDNSGDIILDAVLTDLGRKRMADGNFSITKFGCGDDEINYNLYDLFKPLNAKLLNCASPKISFKLTVLPKKVIL